MTEINLFSLLSEYDYDMDENTGEFIIYTPNIQSDDTIIVDIPCKISSNCNTTIKCKLFKITSDILHINSINFDGTVYVEGTRDFSISNCTIKCDGSLNAAFIISECENASLNHISISDSDTKGLLINNSIVTADNISIHHNKNYLLICQNETFLTLTNSNLHHSEESAISVTDHSRIEISKCQFSDTDLSLFYCYESFCSIKDSTFTNSKVNGLNIFSTSDFLIENNEFSKMEKGISINENSCGTINKNTIHDISIHGIFCGYSSDVLITNNTIHHTTYPAIYIYKKSASTIKSNKISQIKSNGISARYAQHVKIEDTEIDGVEEAGVSTSNSNSIVIQNSRISNCKSTAVDAFNGANVIIENSIIKNPGKHAFLASVCATICAKNNEIDSVTESMAKLFFKGGGDFIDNKISNCLYQCQCDTTNFFIFKGNGNFPAVSNDKSRIDESVIYENLLTEENSLCMKCKKNKRCCYLIECGHKVLCSECAEMAVKEKDKCPICYYGIYGFTQGVGCVENDGLCCICYENKADCLLIPCGHIVSCSSCLENWFKSKEICPFCRNEESKYVQLFDF